MENSYLAGVREAHGVPRIVHAPMRSSQFGNPLVVVCASQLSFYPTVLSRNGRIVREPVSLGNAYVCMRTPTSMGGAPRAVGLRSASAGSHLTRPQGCAKARPTGSTHRARMRNAEHAPGTQGLALAKAWRGMIAWAGPSNVCMQSSVAGAVATELVAVPCGLDRSSYPWGPTCSVPAARCPQRRTVLRAALHVRMNAELGAAAG